MSGLSLTQIFGSNNQDLRKRYQDAAIKKQREPQLGYQYTLSQDILLNYNACSKCLCLLTNSIFGRQLILDLELLNQELVIWFILEVCTRLFCGYCVLNRYHSATNVAVNSFANVNWKKFQLNRILLFLALLLCSFSVDCFPLMYGSLSQLTIILSFFARFIINSIFGNPIICIYLGVFG